MDGMEIKSVIHKQLVSCALRCWMEGGNNLASVAEIIFELTRARLAPISCFVWKGQLESFILCLCVCECEWEEVKCLVFWYWLDFSVSLLTWHAWLFHSAFKYSEILRYV